MTNDPMTRILFATGVCIGCVAFAFMGFVNIVITVLFVGFSLLIYSSVQFGKYLGYKEKKTASRPKL
jgi:hypothetical protein